MTYPAIAVVVVIGRNVLNAIVAEPDTSTRLRMSDWIDPDPTWRRAWKGRRQASVGGVAVVLIGVLLEVISPLDRAALGTASIACFIVGVVTAAGIPVVRLVRFRLRDTWLMGETWRTRVLPVVVVALVLLVVVFGIVVLIVRIRIGDPTVGRG